MFGIGFQEVLIIALLALIVFGPRRLLNMIGDLSRLADEARRSVDEFQSELVASEKNEPRRETGEAEPMLLHSAEDGDKAASSLHPNSEHEAREPAIARLRKRSLQVRILASVLGSLIALGLQSSVYVDTLDEEPTPEAEVSNEQAEQADTNQQAKNDKALNDTPPPDDTSPLDEMSRPATYPHTQIYTTRSQSVFL